jgi:hypothetical protein
VSKNLRLFPPLPTLKGRMITQPVALSPGKYCIEFQAANGEQFEFLLLEPVDGVMTQFF